MAHRKILAFIFIFALISPAFLAAQDGAHKAVKFFADGNLQLQKGNFNEALNAYTAASKADPNNAEYTQQAMLIRRVIMLRKSLDNTEFSPRWEKMALSLHAFYMTYKIYDEALALDKQAHEKMNNATSASLLAESLMAAGKNAEALALLEGLNGDKLNQQNRLYLGIALARMDRKEEAGKIRDELNASEASDIGFLFDMARIHTLLNDSKQAYSLLTRCFENTPPSQLEQIKSFVKGCADFKPLMASADFKGVMQTQSKVVESSCSGGTSCGSCPSRANCGQAAEQAKTDASECGDCDDQECGSCDKK